MAALVAAQTPSEPQIAFEVASVKPHPLTGMLHRAVSSDFRCPPYNCGISGNRFSEEVSSLMDLIMDAYNVKRFQISGLPGWGNSGRDVYDITAKVEGDGTPTLDQVRRMLQTLLADRFQLKLHRESRELPVYALVVGKNGSKLVRNAQEDGKPPAACPTPSVRPDAGGGGGRGDTGKGGGGRRVSPEVAAFRRLWERVPETLSAFTDRPVIDKTGLEGSYCTNDGQDPIDAVLSQLGLPEGDSGWPNLFPLVQQKWGLKLEPQRAVVDILVIDRVERPSAN